MPATSNWRSSVGATDRYENISKLKKCIEARGLNATGNSHKTAFAAETEAYNESETREDYDSRISKFLNTTSSAPSLASTSNDPYAEPTTPGIAIGPYTSCHHLASGTISSIYRCQTLALKVITETHATEPHNPSREIAILKALSHPNITTLHSTFRDQDHRLVLVFPFYPLTLTALLADSPIPLETTKAVFGDVFTALAYLHAQGILHRDIKPSNILLSPSTTSSPSSTAPKAILIDFGTAFHPTLSPSSLYPPPELPSQKQIEVGTSCYRAPETLFGSRVYSTSLDLWSTGTMLFECLVRPSRPLFESRECHEDGNQLGLILSMFKTLGTPTEDNWPEARDFPTPPFRWYAVFEGKSWEDLMPGVGREGRELVEGLVKWEGAWRITAEQALKHPFFSDQMLA